MSEVKRLIAKVIGDNKELREFYENEKDKIAVDNLVFNLRNKQGLSQSEFAEENHISLERLQRIEAGV